MKEGEFHISQNWEDSMSQTWHEFCCNECCYGHSRTLNPDGYRVTLSYFRFASRADAEQAALDENHRCTNMRLRDVEEKLDILLKFKQRLR